MTKFSIPQYTLFFSDRKNVVFSGQTEYSYFSANFSLNMFLYYSWIITEKEKMYDILFAVCSIFFAVYYTYIFYALFIELSLALIIFL